MDVYRIVAWLGFVPNLLIVEWLIRQKRQRESLPIQLSGKSLLS
jgi:hypothetical protein